MPGVGALRRDSRPPRETYGLHAALRQNRHVPTGPAAPGWAVLTAMAVTSAPPAACGLMWRSVRGLGRGKRRRARRSGRNAPAAEQKTEVASGHRAVAIKIRGARARSADTPLPEQQAEIGARNRAIAVKVR